MTRIASRAPDLDVFGQKLIEREAGCWIITVEGRRVLEILEQLDRAGAHDQVEPETAQRPNGGRLPLVRTQQRTIARKSLARRKRLNPRKGRLA